jgi:DNA-binding transcriptional LysR family regulator
MKIDDAQLAALAAVVREGRFDAAARRLHVTPSAVSQRIRALEERCGAVLVTRDRPCRATEFGAPLCRHAERVARLEQELRQALPAGAIEAGPLPCRHCASRSTPTAWRPGSCLRRRISRHATSPCSTS